jgi:hypothetical protein
LCPVHGDDDDDDVLNDGIGIADGCGSSAGGANDAGLRESEEEGGDGEEDNTPSHVAGGDGVGLGLVASGAIVGCGGDGKDRSPSISGAGLGPCGAVSSMRRASSALL